MQYQTKICKKCVILHIVLPKYVLHWTIIVNTIYGKGVRYVHKYYT